MDKIVVGIERLWKQLSPFIREVNEEKRQQLRALLEYEFRDAWGDGYEAGSMETKTVTDWLSILSELCRTDVFGHESWFSTGVEQHKSFFYCFIGDCSVTEEDGWKSLESLAGESLEGREGRLWVGSSRRRIESAIIRALAKALEASDF